MKLFLCIKIVVVSMRIWVNKAIKIPLATYQKLNIDFPSM